MISTNIINTLEIESLIWDWNGTLLDDVEVNIRTVNDMLSKRGLDLLEIETYKDTFCFPVKHFHSQIGFDFEKESFEDIAMEYHYIYKQYENDIRLNSDAKLVLDILSKNGTNQFILSAAKQTDLIKMLNQFNLVDKFKGIYGVSDSYATGKIERGQQLMQDYSLNPQKTLLIGDTLHDAEVATSLGVNYILYSGGHNSHQLLSEKAQVISSLKEIVFS